MQLFPKIVEQTNKSKMFFSAFKMQITGFMIFFQKFPIFRSWILVAGVCLHKILNGSDFRLGLVRFLISKIWEHSNEYTYNCLHVLYMWCRSEGLYNFSKLSYQRSFLDYGIMEKIDGRSYKSITNKNTS